MRFSRLTGLAVSMLCAGVAARADDSIATDSGPLVVHPIHHASLMLTWNGKHVLADPAPVDKDKDPTTPYRALPAPDLIVVTHIHGDHFNVPILEAVAGAATVILAPQDVYDAMPADLKSKTKVMKNGDRLVADSIPVEAVAMYNTTSERMKFHPKGLGNGYILTIGVDRIYIAGDTEEAPELAHLANIDVAFVPMNLPFTETVDAAAKWVRDFKPKIVYPYHYHNSDGSLSDLNEFKTLVGDASDVRLRDWY